MIDIQYTFKVTQVDEALKLMLVEYSADGYETVSVSMPFPYADVVLENHIRSYAPIGHWVMSKKTFQTIEVGVTGTINHGTPTALPQAIEELSEEDIMKLVDELKTS